MASNAYDANVMTETATGSEVQCNEWCIIIKPSNPLESEEICREAEFQ